MGVLSGSPRMLTVMTLACMKFRLVQPGNVWLEPFAASFRPNAMDTIIGTCTSVLVIVVMERPSLPFLGLLVCPLMLKFQPQWFLGILPQLQVLILGPKLE